MIWDQKLSPWAVCSVSEIKAWSQHMTERREKCQHRFCLLRSITFSPNPAEVKVLSAERTYSYESKSTR